MRQTPFRPTLLAILLATLPYASHAAELPTIRVTATPTQDQTINQETLAKQQAQDLQDIYNSDSAISIGGGGNPVAQKVYIRGLEESLLNMTIDGAFHNGKIYHHQTALMIDPLLLKKVEVEKGTASASAGPGALAGAMRLETVSARDLLRAGESSGAIVGLGVSSNKGWRSNASAFGVLDNGSDLLFSLSRQQQDYYKDGNGQRLNESDSNMDNVLFKLGVPLANKQSLQFNYQHSDEHGIRNARANMVGFFHPVVPNDPIPQSQLRDTSSIRYQALGLGAIDRAEVLLHRTAVDSDRTSKVGRNYGESLRTHGLDINLKSSLGEHLLRYGLNWREDESRARQISNSQNNTGSGHERASVLGGYTEAVLSFSPLTLAAGLRFDSYDYRDNHGQNFSSSGASPSLQATFDLNDNWQLKGGHARALRGVGLKEAFMLDIASWKNASEIDPEKASNSELGLQYQRGGLKLAANVFNQRIDNFVTSLLCIPPRGVCRDNAGTAKVKGYELSADYQLGQLSAGLNVSHSKPKLNGRLLGDGDLGLGTYTGRTWVAHLGYQLPQYQLELGWQGRLTEGIDYQPVAANGTTMRKDGYAVHDVYLTWKPSGKSLPRVNFAVKNLFDKAYYDQATYAYQGAQQKVLGYPEAGRDFRLDLSWQF